MKYLPSGRYMSDYIYTMKFLRKLKIVGFTLNVEHCKGWYVTTDLISLDICVLLLTGVVVAN